MGNVETSPMVSSFYDFALGTRLFIVGSFVGQPIFRNEGNGYCVSKFSVEKIKDEDGSELKLNEEIKITGYYEPKEKMSCTIKGTVAVYRDEKQVSAEIVEYPIPTGIEAIISFLGSGLIKGLGEKTAEKVVRGGRSKIGKKFEGFGDETLNIIMNQPELLTKIPGINSKKAQDIHNSYMENMDYQNVMIFFQKYGVTPAKIVRIYQTFKGSSIEIAKRNPYKFSAVSGFGFKTCDEIARKLGLSPHESSRIEAGIIYTLNEAESDGHCYLTMKDLISETSDNLSICLALDDAERLLKKNSDKESANIETGGLEYSIPITELKEKYLIARRDKENFKEARLIIDLITESEVEVIVEAMISQRALVSVAYSNEICIYKPEMYETERLVSEYVLKILQIKPELPNLGIHDIIKEFEDSKGFCLEEKQKEAIHKSFETNFMILTGSAGSGKTTTVEGVMYALMKVFNKNELSIMLAAPTGKAAKRMSEVTGYEAKTIHRLLEYTYDGGFAYNKDNHLSYDVLVIDETSMLDTSLCKSLLAAVKPGTKVIFIGDVQQLPAVGAGNVLNDLIKSNIIPVVELNVIKRQADNSGIVKNANAIVQGRPICTDDKNRDFFVIDIDDKLMVADKILDIVSKLVFKYNFSIDKVQVICPQKTSEIGTIELNKRIQEIINPHKPGTLEVKKGNVTFRLLDKVIHLSNNYKAEHHDKTSNGYEKKDNKGVFNGEIGQIIEIFIDKDDDESDGVLKVAVQYEDFIILYEKSSLEEIDLAYCLTVHKMQGSQCEIAVIPWHYRNYIMLNRNLGYTAVTRAKRAVYNIGQEKAIATMVKNVKVVHRNTMLSYLLSNLKGCV